MILTPDQRLRVYVSSAPELAGARAAALDAIRALHLVPVDADVSARTHHPAVLRRAYVEQSHVFVGLYGESYGHVDADEVVSDLEDEFRLSVGKPRLLYVKEPAPRRDPRLEALIARVIDEDAASFRPFRDAAELGGLVADDLALLLTERFEGASGREDRSGGIAPEPPSARLPDVPTRLVGRERELAEVEELLLRDDVRLVTLSGVGGIGKSRLAIEVARRLRERFADGVRLVRLDGIPDADMVLAAIAGALGVRHEGDGSILETLAVALRDAHLLLVCDNFEHVIDAAPDLSALLARCPGLTVLVTSRRLLHVAAEHEYRVPPLPVPLVRRGRMVRPPGEPASTGTAATELFVDRARRVRPAFTVTADNADVVARIVCRLDGIPLAIELAAARLRVLTAEALLERLDSHLDMSAGFADLPERQRTLRATLDWSYSLLADDERTLFARLGTFVGGWDLDAAEAVCGDGIDVLDTLAALVEHSLIVIDTTVDSSGVGGARFRMLETIRQYARERLGASGELDDVDARHRRYFRGVAEAARIGLHGVEQQAWLERLEADAGNVRSVVHRAIRQGRTSAVAALGRTLWVWLWLDNHISEVGRWMRDALENDDTGDPAIRAQLLWNLAGVHFEQGDYADAKSLIDESFALFEELGDDEGMALGYHLRAAISPALPGAPPAEPHAREAQERFRALGMEFGALFASFMAGMDRSRLGDLDGAQEQLEETLRRSVALGNAHLEAFSRQTLASVHLLRGDLDRARDLFVESLEISVHLGNDEATAYGIDGLAGLALFSGDPGRTAVLLGAADRLRSRSGLSVWPVPQQQRDLIVAAARDALGDHAFDVARRTGLELARDDAVAYAFEAAVGANVGAGVGAGVGAAPHAGSRPGEREENKAPVPTGRSRVHERD